MFIFLMMANPAIQEKAQEQIDAVVGRTRLPTAGDRPSLPYIDAIFREILRLNPPIPLCRWFHQTSGLLCDLRNYIAVPHATLNDDVYAGFHIPKGDFLESLSLLNAY